MKQPAGRCAAILPNLAGGIVAGGLAATGDARNLIAFGDRRLAGGGLLHRSHSLPAPAAYATVLTAVVTFLPFWLSTPRYLLSTYPHFLLVGRVRNRWLYLAMAGGSFTALVIFGLAFGRGYWAF